MTHGLREHIEASARTFVALGVGLGWSQAAEHLRDLAHRDDHDPAYLTAEERKLVMELALALAHIGETIRDGKDPADPVGREAFHRWMWDRWD
jgi:hypothetical protein